MEIFDELHILRLLEELRPSPLHHFRFELIPEVSQNRTAGRGSAGFAQIQEHSEAKKQPSNLAHVAARMDALAKTAVAEVTKQVENEGVVLRLREIS